MQSGCDYAGSEYMPRKNKIDRRSKTVWSLFLRDEREILVAGAEILSSAAPFRATSEFCSGE